MRTDTELQHAVQRELEWDARIDHAAIGVAVHNGIVTLSGSTGSWATRKAAQAAAHRVDGMLDVANDIRVRVAGNGVRDDADIAAAVRLALEWNVFVPHKSIRSTVSDGQVTLEGQVESLAQRDDAEKAIEHLAGVLFVINDITVKPQLEGEMGDVRQAIHDALERRAGRESHRIRVENQDGIVTLTGACHTWADKKAVVGAARGTRGVRSVQDQLRIEP